MRGGRRNSVAIPYEPRGARWFPLATAALLIGSAVGGTAEWLCPSYLSRTRLNVTRFHLESEAQAVEQYRSEKGVLPDNLKTLDGTYIRSDGRDAWDRPYVYRRLASGDGYVLYSVGANGTDQNGAGDDVLTSVSSKKYSCDDYEEICVSPCQVAKASGIVVALVALFGILLFAGYAAIRAVTRRAA